MLDAENSPAWKDFKVGYELIKNQLKFVLCHCVLVIAECDG
jgi:hypothetical protein